MINKRAKGIIILSILILLVVGIACFILFFNENSLNKETSRVLESSGNIKEAIVYNNTVGRISLSDSVNLSNVESINLIFYGDEEYSLPISDFKQNYEVASADISVENFKKIKRVEAIITYKSVSNVVDNGGSGGGGSGGSSGGSGGGSGDTGGQSCTPRTCNYYYNLNRCGSGLDDNCDASINCGSCPDGKSCINESCVRVCEENGCSSAGTFCDGNLSYSCTLVDGCYNRANLSCGNNQECVNGVGCRNIVQCTTDANCISYNSDCATGKCNSSTGTCFTDFKSSSTICRTASGVCGVAETCTGNSAACQPDVNLTGTVCRVSEGVCDVAEACNGNSDSCPADAKSTLICRASAGICDIAESCDGVNKDCPTNIFSSSSTVCKAIQFDCDAEEKCNGTSAICPTDVNKTNGAVCSGGTCQNGKCTCVPSCVGKTCGSDGCSTWGCGLQTASCTQAFGTCTATGTKTCSGSTYGTCIATDPRTANCAGKECGSDLCGGTCGPQTTSCTQTFGTCTTTGTKTCSGNTYSSCSAVNPITANCAGKQCGTNGCGGTCGSCTTGTCNQATGQCEVTCTPSRTCSYYYNLNQCGNLLSDGCSNILNCQTCPMGKTCQSGTCVSTCTNDIGCSSTGTFCDGNSIYSCSLGGDGCYDRANGVTCASGQICVGGACTCSPSCVGKQCGSDGCSTWGCGPATASCTSTFGTCTATGTKTCSGNTYGSCSAVNPIIANCLGKECGSDNCGGLCGPATTSCTQTFGTCTATGTKTCSGNSYGTCIATDPRITNCVGKQCGSDNCGGTCGPATASCTSTFGTCTATGTKTCSGNTYGSCSAVNPIIANCLGKECGSDNCGGLCGPATTSCTQTFGTCTATGTKTCSGNSYGTCIATDPRITNCVGKQCGSDNCGGTCGPATASCTSTFGTCTATGTKTCSGNTYGSCSAVNPIIANCLGKECGSDNCGGLCGPATTSCTQTFGTCTATGTKTCSGNSYGTCIATDPRITNCVGKQCGSDNCGGTCGPCGTGQTCNTATGQCVATNPEIPNDYIAYYNFENNANDEKGSNNGVMYGSPVFVDGFSGKSLNLNGVNDYVNIGTLGSFGAYNGQAQMRNGLTFSAWVKFSNSNEASLFGNTDSGTSILSLVLDSNTYGGSMEDRQVFKWMQHNGAGSQFDFVSNINNGKWHNIIISTSVGGSRLIYIDGNLVSVTASYSNSPISIYQYWQISSPGLTLGGYNNGGVISKYFNGSIDTLMIYPRNLSDSEIQSIYASQLQSSNIQCAKDSDCNTDGCYSGQKRDYYCDGNNQCKFNDVTIEEKDLNSNCADGIDNNCDGKIDLADDKCHCTPSCSSGYTCYNGECKVSTPTETASSITKNGITWNFDKSYTVGKFASGDYWVLNDNDGVNVVSVSYDGGITPTNIVNPTTANQNGISFNIHNLQPGYSLVTIQNKTGFQSDCNTYFIYWRPGYKDVVGDCRPDTDSHCLNYRASVLTVLSSVPPKDSLRPPLVGDKKPLYNIKDLRTDLLPKLQMNNRPSVDYVNQVANWFSNPWLDYVSDMGAVTLHPIKNMPDYGREVGEAISSASVLLLLNYTDDEIKPLLINYFQYGVDASYAYKSGMAWVGGGGHDTGRKLPILFTGIILDDDSLKKLPNFIEDGHTYFGQNEALWGEVCEYGSCYMSNGCAYSGSCQNGAKDCRDPNGLVDACDYRTLNSPIYVGEALVALMMKDAEGRTGKYLWNNSAFFDYTDRWMKTGERGSLGERASAEFVVDFWDQQRNNYGCTWYASGWQYNCSGVIIDCDNIHSCSQYPNQRAKDYDPCNLGCNENNINEEVGLFGQVIQWLGNAIKDLVQ